MASTSRSSRRRTSASVRTVVVLPVPPFSDSTEMVWAMGAATLPAPRGPALWLLRQRSRCRADRLADRRRVQEPQRVPPDDDLVAVLERTPFDAAAVDVDAVERAVVEHPRAIGLMDDQGMAAGDRRVVEADVGGQRTA